MTASTFYLEHFQLDRAPFDQEPDTGIYFPAAGRDAVLENLLADIGSGRTLMKLTGSEGTGKTLMCRRLEQTIDTGNFVLISLEPPIGSFENLLRTVCLALGTEEVENEEDGQPPPRYAELFRAHLLRLEREGKKVLLLVDEAENLFLATLERLVRLICSAEEGRNLQVLLVGRLELDTNLEQLAVYCSNVDTGAGYSLQPLSPEETLEYIRFRVRRAGIPGDKHLDLFSDDAVELIYQISAGNMSLINSLAEQGLKKACAEGMFRVDEEMIEVQQSLEENVSLAFFQGFDFIKDNKWWLLAGTLLVWVILMMLWPDGDRHEPAPVDDQRLEIITPSQEIVVPPEPEEGDIGEPSAAVPAEEEMAVRQEMPESDKVEMEPVRAAVTPPSPAAAEGRQKVLVEPDRRKVVVPPEQVPAEKKLSAVRDADALFNERVKASSTWLAWAYRGGYTVQLMVLASDKAEENLKKILVDDNYYEIRDMLYILRKRTPYTIYLFYGNFPNMDEAREVRNKMPPFLRETQPYVLSIHDALKKIEE